MLSAVAARKARLAQSQQSATPPASDTSSTTAADASSEKPKVSKKPTSKRKLSGQVPAPSPDKKKKRAKHDEKKQKPVSNAGTDAFAKQDDVIVIEDEESSSSEEDVRSTLLPRLVASEVPSSSRRRAWSPSNPVYDSSDDEAHDVPVNDLLDIPVHSLPKAQPSTVTLSTFQPTRDYNLFRLSPDSAARYGLLSSHDRDSTSSLLALAPGETVCLLGTYTITVLAGSVSLCGSTLSASSVSHRVFAPRSSPIPVIRCVSSDPSEFPSELPSSVKQAVPKGGSLVWLEGLRTHVEGLGRICRTFDGVFSPSRWQSGDNLIPGVSGVHLISQSSRDAQVFCVPDSWDAALSAVLSHAKAGDMKPPVCLVKGPKNAGKSTFARTLLNRLVTKYARVAFLECDLGQSEFTPGGMVALNVLDTPLFGPPFTHMSIPNHAHYIGSASPRSSPSQYLSSIHALLQSYRLDIQFLADASSGGNSDKIGDVIPLVVNTMGWTKGLGADLSRKIEEMVEPSDVFEFEPPIAEYIWPAVPAPSARPQGDARYYTLECVEPSVLSTNFSSADHRTMSILSYFHTIFPPQDPSSIVSCLSSTWNVALPLCAQRPYELDWADAIDRVYLAGPGTEDVVSSEVVRVLNGAIVGLVECEQGTLDAEMDEIELGGPEAGPVIPYTQGAAPPSPLSSNCHGLALIRGVSSTSTHLQILTPVPPLALADARVLVKGELELPVWGMLDFRFEDGQSIAGVDKGSVPYLRWGKEEGLGAERRRVRRNLMRKGQM